MNKKDEEQRQGLISSAFLFIKYSNFLTVIINPQIILLLQVGLIFNPRINNFPQAESIPENNLDNICVYFITQTGKAKLKTKEVFEMWSS